MFGPAKVSNVVIDVKKPSIIKIDDKQIAEAIQKTLPDKHFVTDVSFDISNVSHALSNAIRRTISCELPVKSLMVDSNSWESNDRFLAAEVIIKRLRMIPLDQKTPIASTYRLMVTNNTTSVRDVKTSEIITVNGPKLPFNSNYTICTLQPGKSLTISEIYVHETITYVEGNGMNALASGVISTALDVEPINAYESNNITNDQYASLDMYTSGVPSSISNPREWQIKFSTNGTIDPNLLIATTCDNLIQRVNRVDTLIDGITNINNEYILIINGESHTIGNLFMRTICDMYEDIPFVVYSVDNFERICNVRVITSEDIEDIFKKTIKYLVSVLESIKKNFD